MADGVLEFSLREGRHEYETVMSIKKLRNLRKPVMLPFTVEENGITIETASRIA
jgi:KaiC/GvpD/RAD55 family RecA-like ATPase